MASLQIIAKWATILLTNPTSDKGVLRNTGTDATTRAQAAGLSLPDLAEEVYYFGRHLADTVSRAENRLKLLDEKVNGSGFPTNVEPFVQDAQRITTAMRMHLSKLKETCQNINTPQFLEVRNLIDAKLEVPEFGRELLGSEGGNWTRPLKTWQTILDVMLRRAEYRVKYQQYANDVHKGAPSAYIAT